MLVLTLEQLIADPGFSTTGYMRRGRPAVPQTPTLQPHQDACNGANGLHPGEIAQSPTIFKERYVGVGLADVVHGV